MIVTTLPITVRPIRQMTIGSLLGPFVASVAAKYLGAQFTLSLNTLGQKISADVEGDMREFLDKLRYFDILPHDVWADSQYGYRAFFSDFFSDLVRSGNIRIVEAEVVTCPCGALEIPMEHARSHGKTYSSCGKKLVCKKCLGVATPNTAPFLTYQFSEYLTTNVLPAWVNSEATEFASRFSSSNLRISRLRNTDVVEQIGGRDFFIDIDFFWSCYISYLERFSTDGQILVVTSNRTIRQALFSAWLRGARPPSQSTTILTTPILRYINRGNRIETLSLPIEYLAKKDPGDVRFMLAQALSWKMKESQIGSDVWYWIEHSRKPREVLVANVQIPPPTPSGFISTVSASTAKTLLSSLRKRRRLGRNETILYDLLF